MCCRLRYGKLYGKLALLCVANLFGRLGLRGGWCGLWVEVLRPQLRPKWVVAIRVVPGVAPFEWLIGGWGWLMTVVGVVGGRRV